MRLEFRIGIGRRQQVVRPVVQGRQATIERLGQCQPYTTCIVLRREQGSEHTAVGEVAGLLFLARHVARNGTPHVPMGFNKTRRRDHALRLDARSSRWDIRRNGDDLAIANMDVPFRQVADSRIDADDECVANDELAALRQCCRCGGTGLRRGRQRLRHETRSADSCTGTQQLPAAQSMPLAQKGARFASIAHVVSSRSSCPSKLVPDDGVVKRKAGRLQVPKSSLRHVTIAGACGG